jgi:N-acetylmuramoyl-L-alanine amidase
MINSIDKKRKIILALTLIFAYSASALLMIPYQRTLETVVYKYGSSGDEVKQIQTKLKNWGYYFDGIDGIYGYKTYTAVKYFQSKNGLTSDGIAGNQTLAAMGISTQTNSSSSSGGESKSSNSNQNSELLARLINGEARGEPYEGQVAVGAVVLNRVGDSRFPSTIAGVIYQPGAFTAIADGQINATVVQSSINAAQDALNGWDPSGGAVYYFNPNTATNAWIWSRPLIKVIGKHRFCH